MARRVLHGAGEVSDRGLAELTGAIYETTGAIYETIERPERWPQVLAQIARTLNAKSGLIRSLDLQGQRRVVATHHHNLDQRLQREYCDGLVANDPYLEALDSVPVGQMVTNDGLIDLDRLRKTWFYRHYLGPLDNHYVVGGFVERDDEGRYTILGFHRHHAAVQFDRDELALVQRIVPHVKRAVRLQRLLGHERRRADSAESALDALSVATLLLDRQSRLVHANDRAERLLRKGEGLCLRSGRVTASDHKVVDSFHALITHSIADSGGWARPSVESLLIPAGDAVGSDLLAVAVPVERSGSRLRDHWPSARVAMYVGDLDDTGTLRPEVLRTLYGLTVAESRLAVAIGRGRELGQLSAEWNVSTETLRSHLKAIFAKTGVRRQVELVRLLAGAPWKLTAPLAQEGVEP